MSELHFPWLELAIVAPLLGLLSILRQRDAEILRTRSLIASGISLIFAIGAWIDFGSLHAFNAHDHWDAVASLVGKNLIVIDEFSAPLFPLAALLHFLVIFSTLRTKVRHYPFRLGLVSLALLLVTLSCREPGIIILLLAAQTVPVLMELRSNGRSTRVFVVHMGLSIGLLAAGWCMLDSSNLHSSRSVCGAALLMAGALVRCGVVPVHCWMTDLFEKATLGTALLYVTPMAGAYAVVRLVLPVSPDWVLRGIAIVSLVTAVYAGAMTLVQSEARRLFCYLFLSQSSLVLVGLEVATPIGLTGGLCVWLSVGLSLAGFGLTLRALESRTGRLSLADYHGLYDHMPTLAVFFLLTGLASVGFPGTIGFIGMELLIDGAVSVYPYVGMLVVLVAALNGIAILLAFFRLFTGTIHTSSVSLHARLSERVAVLLLTALILGGGLWPQPGVSSRYHAATEIIARRNVSSTRSEAVAENATDALTTD